MVTSCVTRSRCPLTLLELEDANAKVGAERPPQKSVVIYYVDDLGVAPLEWRIDYVHNLAKVSRITAGSTTLGVPAGPRQFIADQLLAKADVIRAMHERVPSESLLDLGSSSRTSSWPRQTSFEPFTNVYPRSRCWISAVHRGPAPGQGRRHSSHARTCTLGVAVGSRQFIADQLLAMADIIRVVHERVPSESLLDLGSSSRTSFWPRQTSFKPCTNVYPRSRCWILAVHRGPARGQGRRHSSHARTCTLGVAVGSRQFIADQLLAKADVIRAMHERVRSESLLDLGSSSRTSFWPRQTSFEPCTYVYPRSRCWISAVHRGPAPGQGRRHSSRARTCPLRSRCWISAVHRGPAPGQGKTSFEPCMNVYPRSRCWISAVHRGPAPGQGRRHSRHARTCTLGVAVGSRQFIADQLLAKADVIRVVHERVQLCEDTQT